MLRVIRVGRAYIHLLAVAAVWSLLAPTALAQPTFHSSTSGTGTTATVSITHTTGAGGSDGLLLFVVSTRSNLTISGTPTYDGDSLSLLRTDTNGALAHTEIWYRLAPSTTASAVLSASLSADGVWTAAVMSFEGVLQSAGGWYSTHNGATGTSGSASVTLSGGATDELVVDVFARKGGLGSASTTNTSRWTAETGAGGGDVGGGSATMTGGATVTPTWSFTSDKWAISAVSLKPNPKLTVSGITDLGPSITAGDTNVAIAYLTVSADIAQTITSFKFTFPAGSTVADADVISASVVISNDTTFGDADDTTLGTDSTSDIVTNGATCTGSVALSASTTYYIYMVLSFSGGSGGKKVKLDVYNNGASSTGIVTNGQVVGASNLQSSLHTIASPSTSKFTVDGHTDSAASVNPLAGGTYTFMAIKVLTNLTPTLDKIKVMLSGTSLTNADIDSLGIYISTDAVYDAGDTTFASSVAYDGVTASVGTEYTVDGTNYTGSSGEIYYILFRVSVSASATPGRGIYVQVDVTGSADAADKFVVTVDDPKVMNNYDVSDGYKSSERTIPDTFEVDGDGGRDYTTIQGAVDDVPASSTVSYVIRVFEYTGGTYAGFDVASKGTTPILIEGNDDDWPVVNNGAGDDDGIFIDGSTAVTIQKMEITNNGNSNGEYGIEIGSGGDGTTLKNLLIHNNNQDEISINADSVTIENCTIYDDDVAEGIYVRTAAASTGMTLKNTIISITADYCLRVTASADVSSSNYNCFYRSGGGDVIRNGSTGRTLAEWQGDETHDDNSIESDPLFVTAGSDYHVTSLATHRTGSPGSSTWAVGGATSPCIDAGDGSSTYTNEIEDNGNRINMGAFGNTQDASRSYDGITSGTPLVRNYWIGKTDNDWNDHANWAQGIPTTTTDSRGQARINTTNSDSALDVAPTNVGPITLSAASSCYGLETVVGTLTLDAVAFTLDVGDGGVALTGGTLSMTVATTLYCSGNWTETSGTFVPAIGTVVLDGTAQQNITTKSGNNFYALTITGTDVRTTSASTITVKVLDVFKIDAGDKLTLENDDTLALEKTGSLGAGYTHTVSGTLQMNLGTAGGGPTKVTLGENASLLFDDTSTFLTDRDGQTVSGQPFAAYGNKAHVLFDRNSASGGYGVILEGTINAEYVAFSHLRGTEDRPPRTARFPLVLRVGAKADIIMANSFKFILLVDGTSGVSAPNNHNKYVLLFNDTSTDDFGKNSGGGFTADIFPHAGDGNQFSNWEFEISSAPADRHNVQKNSEGDTVIFEAPGGAMAGDYYDLDGTVEAGGTADGADTWGSPGVDDIENNNTTAVTMASKSAVGADGKVYVFWETGSELINLGFNVLRSEHPTGPWTQVNRSLILGQGSTYGGGKYLYVDSNVANGTTYYYLIQDVEYTGALRHHGPVSATPTGGAAAPAIDRSQFVSIGETTEEPAPPREERLDPASASAPGTQQTVGGAVQSDGPLRGTALDLSGIRVLRRGAGFVVLQIIPPRMLRQRVGRFDVLRMGGYGQVTRAGWPQVPEKTVTLTLPGARNARWEILSSDSVTLPGYQPLPVPLRTILPGRSGARQPSGPPASRQQGSSTASDLPADIVSQRAELIAAIRDHRASLRAAIVARRMGRATTGDSPVGRTEQVAARLARRVLEKHALTGSGYQPPEIQLGGFQLAGSDRLLPVTIHPVQYRQEGRSLRVYRQLVVKISYDTGTPAPADDTEARMRAHWAISGTPGAAKIDVSRDGVYRVTLASLAAQGFDTSVDPATYQLFHRGAEVPIRVTAGYIEFVGQRNLTRHAVTGESLYSATSVYWLIGGRALGLRSALNGTPTGASPRSTHTATGLYNRQWLHISSLPTIGPGHDYWFGTQVRTGVDRVVSVPTPGRDAGGTATLELRLFGRTEYATDPDHHTTVWVGGQQVADFTWDGRTLETRTVSFSSALLSDGDTPVTFKVVSDTGVKIDIQYIDYVRIRYSRSFAAASDRLTFETSGGEHRVTGLSTDDVTAWLVRGDKVVGAFDGLAAAGGSARLYASETGRVLLAAAGGVRTPDRVRLDTANRYHDATHGADYLLISHPSFLASIEPLAAFRRAQGLRVFTADVDEVYDAFSFGEFDPTAIKGFVKRAYHRWAGLPPRFLLLVGDATYDYRDYRGKGGMYVPTFMIPTVYYRTASDNWFACVNGADELPDLAVGRLPVRTSAQATLWADKIVTYETNPQAIARKVVFAADNPDTVFDFHASSDAHAALVPAGFTAEKAYLGPLTAGQVKSRILGAFDDGVLLLQFNGHGATKQWATERVLLSADEGATRNAGRYPFVFVTNCLSGEFSSPWYTSISEAFTQSGERGAIGFFASTALNTPWGQHLLATETYKLLWRGMNQVGPLVTMAKNRIGADSAHLDIIRAWTLIGDPALRLASR